MAIANLIFDVTVCLLLMSVSTGLVVTADAGADTGLNGDAVVDAGGVASSLATSTVTVNYSLSLSVDAVSLSLLDVDDIDAHELEQTAHSSLAGFLTCSTLDAVTVGGVRLTRTRDNFQERAAARVASELPARGTLVIVSWTSSPGSSVHVNDMLGPEPPPSATVCSTTFDVPNGLPAVHENTTATSDDGFSTIARLVAGRAVAGLPPPTFVWPTLHDDKPVSTLVAHRYERAGMLAGASVVPEVTREETRAANVDLAAALNPRFAKTIHTRYGTPCAATEAVSMECVTVVVRTWSP